MNFCRCGHCKRLKPEYAKAAEDLVRNDPPVTLVKVDCTEAGKETCNKHSVRGYPTLKIFRNGEFSQEYKGPREANGMLIIMNKKKIIKMFSNRHCQIHEDPSRTSFKRTKVCC